jgi:5-methylcytosine-specific restriction endonuclease McrA
MPANLLFLPNKYTRWYFAIIKNAQVRTITGYVEKHHIIPKSLGGNNSLENLVVLTAREHFVCHWLLTKMVENTKHRYQMWNAFSCMLYRERPGQQRYKVNGKTFENIKKEGAKIKSIKFSGSGNPMYGKRSELNPLFGIKKSPEHIEKIRQGNLGTIRSLESRDKQSKKMRGRTQLPEHVTNRSGVNHPGYGKELDSARKEKIRQGVLNMPLHTCEHCGKTTTKGNYKRWHSDNCKVILGV